MHRNSGWWLTLLLLFGIGVAEASLQQWQFRVFLDEKPIGSHTVSVATNGTQHTVSVRADFAVTFLLVTIYRYQHQADEVWQQDCLQQLSTTTNDNGDELFVRANRTEVGMDITSHAGSRREQGCIRSFAYWQPDWLYVPQLLNTQTGEYEKVDLQKLGNTELQLDTYRLRGEQYRLESAHGNIDLWYDPQGNWLALQSVTESGYLITYLPESLVAKYEN